jgi:hypothetical protein
MSRGAAVGSLPATGSSSIHRKEGDDSNAAYWYQRAGKFHSRESLMEEWNEITRSLLG